MSTPTRRVYDPPHPDDGTRILIDRIWPRGLTKEAAAIDHWLKGVSPSTELRKWYAHDHAKWDEFRRRYFEELDAEPDAVAELQELLAKGTVTFIYASKETKLNNATALGEYVAARG